MKLSTLVSRRNEIAHGENNIISEFHYYKTFEDAVYEVIYDLAYQVETRLQGPPYGSGTQSGKDGYLARPPHTTRHAGPHRAVHEKGAHGEIRHSHGPSSTARGR